MTKIAKYLLLVAGALAIVGELVFFAAVAIFLLSSRAKADYPTPGQVSDPIQWMFSCSDDPCTINYGAGGRVRDFELAYRDLPRYRKYGVRVPGECNSGCIIFLEKSYRRDPKSVCILPGVSLMFHSMGIVYDYNRVMNERSIPGSFWGAAGRPLPGRARVEFTGNMGGDLRPKLHKFVMANGGYLTRAQAKSWSDFPTATYEVARHWYPTCKR